MADLQSEIRSRLEVLAPQSVTIADDSGSHAGHAGFSGGGHFRITVVSPRFAGMNRVTRHRAVYDTLAGLMPQAIHALAITALTPDENQPGL